jgi:PilZ domain
MKLNALLVSRDDSSIRLLQTALGELRIEHILSRSAASATELLMGKRFAAMIIDFELPGASQLARMASIASVERRPAVFALVDGAMARDVQEFAAINFTLYKPLSLEQALRPLRSWQVFAGDRRRSPRRKLEAIVYLQLGVAALPALILDLSEHGLALQAPELLPPVQNVPLRFVLPETNQIIEATGEIIWADDLGRVGMVFSDLGPVSRNHIKEWLSADFVSENHLPHGSSWTVVKPQESAQR